MKYPLITFLFTLTVSYVNGQSEYFKDIQYFDSLSVNGKGTLIYFHFEGCPPCKKMDREVLTDDQVKSFLTSNFNCYSVFDFDELEMHYRNKYQVMVNPYFIFLDKNHQIVNRIVGFQKPEEFIEAGKSSYRSSKMYYLDSLFNNGEKSANFLLEYLHEKDRVLQVDSSLIDLYLVSLTDSILVDSTHFKGMLRFGYYKGLRTIKTNSRLFALMRGAYEDHKFVYFKEDIRNRIVFSLYDEVWESIENKSHHFDKIVSELSKYENGNRHVISVPNGSGFYTMIVKMYPSFELRYIHATKEGKHNLARDIFQEYFVKAYDNATELNSLAWGIYTEEYHEDLDVGIKIIERALELKPQYEFLDTYACLLFKSNRVKAAQTQAIKAIEKGKKDGIYIEKTERLLQQINEALNE